MRRRRVGPVVEGSGGDKPENKKIKDRIKKKKEKFY